MSVASQHIAANAITADKIGANEITVTKLRAGEITVDRLVGAPADNLVPNPNSDATPPSGGWPTGSWELAGLTNYPGAAYQGTWCRKVEALGTNWTALELTPRIPVAEGETVYAEAMVAPEATAVNNGSTLRCGQLVVSWLDATGVEIGTAFGYPAASGSYSRVAFSATAPSGVSSMRLRADVMGQAKKAFIDNMILRKAPPGFKRFSVTMSGTTYSAWTANAEPDTNYIVIANPAAYAGGTPPDNAFILRQVVKQTNGFFLESAYFPGSGKSITWDVVLMRV